MFQALRDTGQPPHHCDWICLARGGRDAARPGPKGDKGDQGAKGDAAPTILEWVLDYDNYRAIPVMSDGSPAPVLELRGLFERFFDETVHGRVIGISARLSDCKRRSDSGASFVSSILGIIGEPLAIDGWEPLDCQHCRWPRGELTFEVGFSR